MSKAHAVVAAIIDGVVLSEEHVSKDPQGLSILRGQVGWGDAHYAVLTSSLVFWKVENGNLHVIACAPINKKKTQNKTWHVLKGYMNPHRYMLMLSMYVVAYRGDISRRRKREGNPTDNKGESWQVVDLAAFHHILVIKTTERQCFRGLMYRYVL